MVNMNTWKPSVEKTQENRILKCENDQIQNSLIEKEDIVLVHLLPYSDYKITLRF